MKKNSHHKRHHHKSSEEISESRKRRRIILVLGLVMILGLGLLAGARILDNRINEKGIRSDTYESDYENLGYARGRLVLNDFERYLYYHNFENFLIMGTDNSLDHGMADFLLLMSIDKTADTYSLIELNRDSITGVRLLGQGDEIMYMQLCIAHTYGDNYAEGCENQVKAVSDMLGGLPISGYYSISMDDIGKINHAFGGVTVTIEEDLTELDPAMKPGAVLKLTDEQAEKYLRARMNVGHGTNEERINRQRAYLESFLEEGKSKVKTAADHYYEIFDELSEYAVTNLTGKQISRIAKALTKNTSKGIYVFDGETEISDELLGDGLEHAEFYVDEDSLVEVMTEVFGLTYDGEIDWDEDEEEN